MSQLFLKRCDKCGGISELANNPVPDGWASLADVGMGTLASFDICAQCQEDMGIRTMIQGRLRARAVGQLKMLIRPLELPEVAESLHYEEIVAKIEAGDFDEVFAAGDGFDLPVTIDELERDAEITDAEIVESIAEGVAQAAAGESTRFKVGHFTRMTEEITVL